jgi:hypothetical protein
VCLQATKTICSGGVTFTTSAAGALVTTFTIPNASPGSYYVDISQGSAPGSYIIAAPFTVTP